MFATHGTPRELESDNGPPFNSKEFAAFAQEEGFHHHRVTPGHARANGEAESFMKLLNKTEKIAHFQQNCDPRNADRLPINTTPCYRNNAVRSTNEQTSKNQVRPSADRKQPRECTRCDDQQEGQRVQREIQAECPQ